MGLPFGRTELRDRATGSHPHEARTAGIGSIGEALQRLAPSGPQKGSGHKFLGGFFDLRVMHGGPSGETRQDFTGGWRQELGRALYPKWDRPNNPVRSKRLALSRQPPATEINIPSTLSLDREGLHMLARFARLDYGLRGSPHESLDRKRPPSRSARFSVPATRRARPARASRW
jgi:hypothetical protein